MIGPLGRPESIMTLRYFAISTLVLSLLVFVLELGAVFALPDISASVEQSKNKGDAEVRGMDVAEWSRMALVGNAVAMSLSTIFVISAVGMLRRYHWSRELFVTGSVGVLGFMVASALHYLDVTQVLHVGYGVALLVLGYWFLFRSKAADGFGAKRDKPKAA